GAVVPVRPAVVRAHEAPRVAVVAAHDAVTPVPAHVEEGVEAALPVPREDHGILAHVGVEVVVDVRDETLVPDHQPRAAEDLRQLVLVDRRVAEDAPVDLAAGRVDDVVASRAAHRLALPTILSGTPAWPRSPRGDAPAGSSDRTRAA